MHLNLCQHPISLDNFSCNVGIALATRCNNHANGLPSRHPAIEKAFVLGLRRADVTRKPEPGRSPGAGIRVLNASFESRQRESFYFGPSISLGAPVTRGGTGDNQGGDISNMGELVRAAEEELLSTTAAGLHRLSVEEELSVAAEQAILASQQAVDLAAQVRISPLCC